MPLTSRHIVSPTANDTPTIVKRRYCRFIPFRYWGYISVTAVMIASSPTNCESKPSNKIIKKNKIAQSWGHGSNATALKYISMATCRYTLCTGQTVRFISQKRIYKERSLTYLG